jgi:serine/threonine protein kinase/ABC-type branched-subunit amino acid transport system substrate-binding protein
MECPYCKVDNRDGVRYCANCGKFISPTALTIPAFGGNPAGNSRSLTPGARLQGGRYVIKDVLGQGGMGAALLANDIRLDNKLVVIKELLTENFDPAKFQDDVRNFKREMSLLAHIDHPLIPSVTDHFQEGTRYFMVQEYVEGENLEDRLRRTGQPMRERDALIAISEILDVLHYLSQQTPPIIHRDIKPANIVINARDKRAYLVDFGIARAEVARNAQRKQTSALGTPGYAPPEQYQGNADPRSDLYALGATLHHLVTNRDPRQHPPFTYPPVRQFNALLSVELELVLTHALVNDITQRYQSAFAMKQAIDHILLHRFGMSSGDIHMRGLNSGQMPAVSNTATATQAPTMLSNPSNTPTISSGMQWPVASSPNLPAYPMSSSPNLPIYPPHTPAALNVTPPPPPVYMSGPTSSPSFPGIPMTPTPSQLPPQQQRKRNSLLIPIILLLVVLLGGTLATFLYFRNQPGTKPTPTPVAANPISITMQGNEPIGLSDGSFAFDVGSQRPDALVKQQAADRYKQNNKDYNGTMALLSQAISQDSNDAEALIYLENMRVLASGSPYVTVVVGLMITGSDALADVGRVNLQGTYVAQKEFNDGSKLHSGVKVRVLIANSGSKNEWAATVAQQIVQLAQTDKTFVGVLGWSFSGRTVQAMQVLGKAHIPMLAATASSDTLTNISPYFFRVAPSNKTQAVQASKYALQNLKAKKTVVFYDKADSYSQTLAADFMQQFKADGGQVLKEEQYTVSKPETLPTSLNDALALNPDFLYFSGYAADLSTVLTNLPPGNLPILGGDALYELGGYPSSAKASFNRLHFTAFAYPDEWEVLGYGDRKPAFFNEYPAAFDPNRLHQGSPYGFTRPANNAILAYDAMVTILAACNLGLSGNKQALTPEELRQALTKINGDNAVQGVSGQISLGPDGDPIDKAIVMLHVSPEGFIQMEPAKLGKFLK